MVQPDTTPIKSIFFFNDTATTEIYTLSLHDALPISETDSLMAADSSAIREIWIWMKRSEEHTSELQSPYDLVCRLLLEKKKMKIIFRTYKNKRTILNEMFKSPCCHRMKMKSAMPSLKFVLEQSVAKPPFSFFF